MSADNWAICPKCRLLAIEKHHELQKKASKAYGEVSPDEYLSLKSKADAPLKLDETLREDYEIGTDGHGVFTVSYSASCECGYYFRYEHGQNALDNGPDIAQEAMK